MANKVEEQFDVFWQLLSKVNGKVKLFISIMTHPRKMLKVAFLCGLDAMGKIQSRIMLDSFMNMDQVKAPDFEFSKGDIIGVNIYWDKYREGISPRNPIVFTIYVNGKDKITQFESRDFDKLETILDGAKRGVLALKEDNMNYTNRINNEIDQILSDLGMSAGGDL